jgi:hypothetical protein
MASASAGVRSPKSWQEFQNPDITWTPARWDVPFPALQTASVGCLSARFRGHSRRRGQPATPSGIWPPAGMHFASHLPMPM